jgi:hypothetical protein
MTYDDMTTHYTLPHGQMPSTSGQHIHLHIEDAAEPFPNPTRRPAIREPALAEGKDILTRLDALERAVACLATEGYGDFGADNALIVTQDEPDLISQIASESVAHATDAIPDDPASVNAKNLAYWFGKGGTTTGGSQSLPPNSREAEGSAYQPGSDHINQPRRLSTTTRTLNPGRSFGVTQDTLQRGQMYKQQQQATNNTISDINARLAAARQHYTGWGR